MLSSATVNCAGTSPLTRALRSQSIRYSLVVGLTRTTTLRALRLPSRVTLAITRSSLSNGRIPGPAMCRCTLTTCWLFTQVPVSVIPVI
ncbi:hypothetical protein [Mycobacterium sp. 1165178.9]|uniref:hypothetical protein n=1 Tax=Mycobacterium sp. 1165178.9 TaxID=1834070 RepID=UPI00350E9322